MIYIPQIAQNDCGIACVKMILATLNNDKNYMYIPQLEDKHAISYQDLINIAKKYGVTLEGYQLDTPEEILKCTQFPLIISLKTPKGGKHSVVVEKVKKKKLKIYDPEIGPYWIDIKNVKEDWDGVALIINNFEQMKCPYEPIEIIKPNKMVISYALQILSGIFTILGVYFIKPEGDLTLSLVLLSIAVLLAVLMKAYTSKVMKKCDTFIDNNEISIKQKHFYSLFESYEKYKKIYFSDKLNLIYYTLISIFVIFITIMNNVLNYLAVLTPILIAAFDVLCMKPIEKQKYYHIERLEDSIKYEKNVDEYKKKVKQAHDESYKYGNILTFKKYIYIFLIVVVAFLTSRLTGTNSITEILFMVCIELFIMQNLNPIFNYENMTNESLKSKIRINSVLRQEENK